jgi:hypothetical protein
VFGVTAASRNTLVCARERHISVSARFGSDGASDNPSKRGG